jgi:hypothetical protein
LQEETGSVKNKLKTNKNMKDSGIYKKYIGSPCKQEVDSKKEKYQDSIQNLHRDAHEKYIKRRTEGYIEDNTANGMGTTYIPPAKDQSKNKNLRDFAYDMEIAKGGSVKKDGVAASKLARMYK